MDNQVFPYTEKEIKELRKKTSSRHLSRNNKESAFPKRLRKLRAESKTPEGKAITQQYVADKIGVTKSTISLYEMGDNVPDAKNIVKLAEIFGVSTDFLLCQTDYQTRDLDVKDICMKTGLSEKAYEIIKHINTEKYNFEYPNTPNKRYDFILNAFLENNLFYELITSIEKILKKCISQNTIEDREDMLEISIIRIQNRIRALVENTLRSLMTVDVIDKIKEMEHAEYSYNHNPEDDLEDESNA